MGHPQQALFSTDQNPVSFLLVSSLLVSWVLLLESTGCQPESWDLARGFMVQTAAEVGLRSQGPDVAAITGTRRGSTAVAGGSAWTGMSLLGCLCLVRFARILTAPVLALQLLLRCLSPVPAEPVLAGAARLSGSLLPSDTAREAVWVTGAAVSQL